MSRVVCIHNVPTDEQCQDCDREILREVEGRYDPEKKIKQLAKRIKDLEQDVETWKENCKATTPEEVRLGKELSEVIEKAAHLEMDLFSANNRIKKLETEIRTKGESFLCSENAKLRNEVNDLKLKGDGK